jgi:hypothetical protein
MNKPITLYSVLLTLAWSSASGALIISSSDLALTGATVDNFSSYATGDPLSVSDGVFTMTQIGGVALSMTDTFNGSYGIVGRSVVAYSGKGINVNFASTVSAFGIHLGATDVGVVWTIEAFNPIGGSLGSGTVLVDSAKRTNGFFFGWSDVSIGSVVLTPSAIDNAIFDNLSYVAVPEPATTALMIGLGAGALVFIRRRRGGRTV